MKISTFASVSLLILLSTPVLAQTPSTPAPDPSGRPTTGALPSRPTGTAGTNPSPAPSTSARSVAADYRLVAGDKLRIDVYKDPQLSQSLQIRPDGKITMPLLGDIVASGRTPTELRDSITGSLKQYITEPVVTVIVMETVPQIIYVMGEVNKAGPQPITPQMTVLQALATAGGFTDFAKTKDIRILRKTSRGTDTIRFNYKDAMRGVGPTINLQSGDTIIVP